MSLRRLLPWLPSASVVGLAVIVMTPLQAEEARRPTKTEESESRLKHDITYLASPECEGRGPTTEGLKKAGDFIAEEFKKAGLKPGNPDGTYFQNFTINGAVLEAPATLAFKGPLRHVIELKQGDSFNPMALGSAGKLADVPVVFAGYGMSAKPKNKEDSTPEYDDYAGLDVEGKIVIVLRDIPRTGDTKQFSARSSFRSQGSLTRKLANAEEHKAAAVIYVNDAETAKPSDDLLDFNFTAIGSRPTRTVEGKAVSIKLPALTMKREVLNEILKSAAVTTLAKVEEEIDKELKPRSMEMKGWTASLEVQMKRDKIPLRNVIGVLEGKGPLADETIIIGAHYDHLGYGGAGGSLAKVKKPTIHPGADDNASGTTSVIELARRFAAMPDREGRRIVFMTFSGEELGLLGSAHYAEHPLYPLAKTTFMLNLDMVGRVHVDDKSKRDLLLAEGLGTGEGFTKLVDEWGKKYDFQLKKTDAAKGYSDHASFYRKKVPVLFFWNGDHADYHRPSDTADKINVPGMRRIVDLSEEVLVYFSTLKERPVWKEVKGSGIGRPNRDGPTLGITPDYASTAEGLAITAVAEDRPAAKAGIKGGDRIVDIAGKPIPNIEAYVQVMATMKLGMTIDVTIVRGDKKQTVKVKLE